MAFDTMIDLDLRLFDGGAADGGDGAPGAATEGATEAPTTQARAAKNPLAGVKYGKQAAEAPQGDLPADGDTPVAVVPSAPPTTGETDARKAEFERLIKGDYKNEFDARVQGIIDGRFKTTKALEARMESLSPVVSMLAAKYGVQGDDAAALARAIEEDNSFYEDEAVEKGLSVEQLKTYKKMERENEAFRRAAEERERQQSAERIYGEWTRQAEALAEWYPGFNLEGECNHPATGKDFVGLLRAGIPLKTAYEVIHKDELLGGAMRYTAEQVQRKTVQDIQTRGMRPQENGTSAQGAADVRMDPRKLTRADRAEIARRVARGEKITF